MTAASRLAFGRATPWVLLTALAVLLVAIGMRHHRLREDFAEHRADDRRLQRGQFVPAFGAVAVSGESLRIADGRPGDRQVVILLTSTCPFCRASLPAWRELARRVQTESRGRQGTVSIIALTTDSVEAARAFAQSDSLPFPLVSLPDPRLASLYRAWVVPQTVILGGDGRVRFVRHRTLEGAAAIDSILAAIADTTPRS